MGPDKSLAELATRECRVELSSREEKRFRGEYHICPVVLTIGGVLGCRLNTEVSKSFRSGWGGHHAVIVIAVLDYGSLKGRTAVFFCC